jgi:hypothetical protein
MAGLNDGQYAAVHASADRLETALKAQDEKAKAVIDRLRTSQPARQFGDGPATVPPELHELQNERDAIIVREIDRLNAALGVKNADKLKTTIEGAFAPNVSVYNAPIPTRIAPPTPHGPRSVPLFPRPSQGVHQ